jgi:hypothetical protein
VFVFFGIKMDFIVRNLTTFGSNEYLAWASEGLIAWAMKVLAHIGRIVFSDRLLNCTNLDEHGNPDLSYSPSSTRNGQEDGGRPTFDAYACELFFHELAKEERLEYSALEDLASRICPGKTHKSFILLIILSYKMKTRSFVSWTKSEWLRGMEELRIHSMPQLIAQTDELLKLWDDETALREMWRYCYDAGKGDSKDMGTPFVKALVEAFFTCRWNLWESFSSYLDDMKIRSLTKDQFYSLFDFQKSVNSRGDLLDYDFEGAWPTLLDEFVEYLIKKSD